MDFAALTHGWSGIMFGFASVQAPMWAGLARGRAELHKYLTSPVLAAPIAALVGIGMSAANPLLAGLGAPQHGVLQFALGTAVSLGLGYAGGLAEAESDSLPNVHQRGAVVADRPPRRETVQRSKSDGKEITLAGTAIPLRDETKHFKLIGTTGTGKSTAIQEILRTALRRGDRAVIADPDGGYLDRFYDRGRGDLILNPFDQRSVKWDLFAEIENGYDVDQLARSLIPDHEGSDRSWRGYARTFFSAVTRQVHQGGEKDVGELYRLLVVADVNELRTLVRGTPAQPFLDEHNSRMFDSIRSVTSSAVGALDYIAQQDAPQFSIRSWVQRQSPGVLFVPYRAGQVAALRSTISAWMRLAIFEAMNLEVQPEEREGEESRRLWFVVDELDALGQIDGLKDALARLRKFGGRCVLGFQSIAQVSSTYGQGDAHTIVENCGNTLILRCSASEGGGTARFASQLIGEREVLRTTVSRSRRQTEFLGSVSRSEHFNVEPAVLPSQIEQLPDLTGYLKHASDPEWHRVRLDAMRRWNESRSNERRSNEPSRHGSPTARQSALQQEGKAHE
ncbi:MAG: type IV secretion system DNA-binding domain-containing protein [Pseudomonadota bacterium]|nr:type IV secretion system DNA-binding domain-containing protein [Pseudomonadota bacterium]